MLCVCECVCAYAVELTCTLGSSQVGNIITELQYEEICESLWRICKKIVSSFPVWPSIQLSQWVPILPALNDAVMWCVVHRLPAVSNQIQQYCKSSTSLNYIMVTSAATETDFSCGTECSALNICLLWSPCQFSMHDSYQVTTFKL